MPDLEKILASIARLCPADQVELARRLTEQLKAEGLWPPRRRPDRAAADLVLLFDGGSRGNPGPAYGSYIITLADGAELRRRLGFGTMTSNEAEYETLVAGLEQLYGLLGEGVGRTRLEVRGDSLLVAEQVQGHWRASDPRMRALRDRTLQLLQRFRSWRFVHVPREEAVQRLGH